MADLRQDQAEISEVLLRYATAIDRKDWELLRTCWTDDLRADYGGLVFDGPDAIVRYMTEAHREMGDTRHQLSNFVIKVDGDRATASSYVHAVLMVRPKDRNAWIDAIGGYDDVLVRTPDGWRIKERTFHLVRMLTNGLDGEPDWQAPLKAEARQ
ncbi:MAG: nuclear transport factor 2 family protein [Frankia sp.]|nr:nuclear transport factor 2 family protein [Frankia sp.]